ncbi:hypothetical protein [Desulfofustis glycolicus]|uniref:Uncharacterized protein n=1 Tax=Desulfofustis glycolicus DSM 9705 TaxID=1121409 RepID=A0A1M5S1B3_9BACT|nr:hypothetical protein [Desulfofustis glycolicus]MCB2216274.1 hypothetical protein [Desulfobulbaceae bacterium]SHH32215.1 hypothetical protein SAMN02745124_00111 [Desulfofustis glycolicus DSM 9705]
MMGCQSNFSLGKYIITVSEYGALAWTTNATFGRTRSGSCSVVGNILILLSCEEKALGYLRLEFQRNQMKLPVWDFSRYYCLSLDLNSTGKRNNSTEACIEDLALNYDHRPPAYEEPGLYRLDRYEICVDPYGGISWTTIDGSGKAARGSAAIDSGILLLKPKHDIIDTGPARLFYSKLRSMPSWQRTDLWGYEASLRSCAARSRGSAGSARAILGRLFSRRTVF